MNGAPGRFFLLNLLWRGENELSLELSMGDVNDPSSRKSRYENHPIVITLGALALVAGLGVSVRTFFNNSSSKVFKNTGPGSVYSADRDINITQTRQDKDANTPDGAREALQRQGKAFDDEGLVDSVREGDVGQVRLYLTGGKSPNDLYNGLPLLVVAMSNHSTHFEDLVDLFTGWKPDPLNFSLKQPRMTVILRYTATAPKDQQTALFNSLSQMASSQDTQEEARRYGKLLESHGASPEELIEALQKNNQDITDETANALKKGTDLAANDRAAGYHTPTEMIGENNRTIEFLKSL